MRVSAGGEPEGVEREEGDHEDGSEQVRHGG